METVKIVKIRGRDRNIQCNSISKVPVSEADFQSKLTGRLHKRDYNGKKVETVDKESPLK